MSNDRPSWLLPTPARRDAPAAGASLRALLLRLMRGENLSRAEAAALLDALLDESATDAQIAGALVALALKGETVEELTGMAEAMRGRAVRITSGHEHFIDTAGTGSSAAKTFNVSTAAAFVIAGAGLPVAKHGSRAATSRSGSADVLSALGVGVTTTPAVSEKCLNELGMCFMFAPLYHGATARVAGVRRELGVHTTFNLLGPLTNPAGAPRQIIGVWHASLVEPLARTLAALGTRRAWVVHGRDGLDEITVSDQTLVADVIRRHGIDALAHFAARIVVPDSVADPLGYYLANTVKTRALIETAVKEGVKHVIFSSTAAVYGEPEVVPVPEDLVTAPINPYGRSKLMSEWMIDDAAKAHGFSYVILRYFNVAGADPRGRSGQSTPNATHLIKVATQAALGQRQQLEVFGTDYPTPDGSCLRDYIQVSDLAEAHRLALDHLRGGGESLTLNCGYGQGYSVLEVIEVVKRVSGVDFPVKLSPRRAGDPARIVAKADRIRDRLAWRPRHDDLAGIVNQALAWEDALTRRNRT